MSLSDYDSVLVYSFAAEVGGVQIRHITEVSGLKIEVDTIELKMNNERGKYVIKQMPGRYKAGEITLTRNYFADSGFKEWMQAVGLGQLGTGRKSGSILLLDTEGNELKRWDFLEGIAKSVELSALKAGGTEPITEKLTIAHSGLAVAPFTLA